MTCLHTLRLRPGRPSRLLLLALLVYAVGGTHSVAAQPTTLTTSERARCITSMARVEVDTPGGILSGSGTLIDPRGYVLTNFHVVGHRNHESGTPGVLRAQRFRIALVRNERDIVDDEYVAEVVRGHVRLDLALLRIVGRADEAPLPSTPFPAMPVRADLAPLSTPVWALGFPAGMRTIHVTAGQIAGFENDNGGQPSWMRTDTEFNPGNSGGALIDASCRMVGVPTAVAESVEPIELARPSTRIPPAWLSALGSGAHLTAEPTEGLREIGVLTSIEDAESGEQVGGNRELRYYRLPAARPGVASVSPRLVIATMGPGGRVIRESQGQVLVTASDGPATLIAVLVPRGRDGRTPSVELRYTPLQDADATGGVASSASASAERHTRVHGSVSRPAGGACASYVAVTPAGLDVRALAARLRSGELLERELRAQLLGLSVLGRDGTFTLSAPEGALQLVVFGPRGVEHVAPLEVRGETQDVGELELPTGCRG
ncbi:MAG: trypsin-like peptidase domain-containing protein [Myxococcales bacterium]|nr:trypsin-like peptidase domain-containing protein [Myxococcales bacterium]MCB9629908.1 trypsin-like peptidase domain-containing protein [Sandaracinaceae bacterium]